MHHSSVFTNNNGTPYNYRCSQIAVAQNFRCPSTLTIKLTFKAHDEERENVACMAEVTAKLAPCKPIGATLQIGNERVDGKLRPVAYEVGAGNKNQLSMLTTEDVLGGDNA